MGKLNKHEQCKLLTEALELYDTWIRSCPICGLFCRSQNRTHGKMTPTITRNLLYNVDHFYALNYCDTSCRFII